MKARAAQGKELLPARDAPAFGVSEGGAHGLATPQTRLGGACPPEVFFTELVDTPQRSPSPHEQNPAAAAAGHVDSASHQVRRLYHWPAVVVVQAKGEGHIEITSTTLGV